MAKVYRNYTVGLDEIAYNHIKDLSALKRISIRQYLTDLIEPEYSKNEKSILELKKVFDSIVPQEVPNIEKKEA